MPTKTDRILSYLPATFRALPKPTALYAVVDAFGSELLQAENSLAALLFAHWVDHADRNAEWIDDLARIAALYGLAPQPEEGVEAFREHLKRYVRTFLEGTVTVQGILRITAEALGLHIADDYDQMDTWWKRRNDMLTTVDLRGDDAAGLLFGVETVHVKGEDAQPAIFVGKVDLIKGIDLGRSVRLRIKVDKTAPANIDLVGQMSLDQIVQMINAQAIGVARSDNGFLVLRTPTTGVASRLEVEETPDDAALQLLGLLPHRYRGTVATQAVVTGKPDLSGGVDLSAVRYLRLLIDGQYLTEVDCAAKAADSNHPNNVQIEQIQQAINEALGLGADVASNDGKHLILTSPTKGFNSSIAFQPAAAQDAKERLFGPIETFHAGQNARSAEVIGINDLSLGVDLSTRSMFRIRVDNRPPVTVSCAGSNPTNTLLSEITTALTAQLGLGTSFHDGRFLHLTSPTSGHASTLVFEPLPPDEDATDILFGIGPRVFNGSDTTHARFIGKSDLSAGVDLAALHALQIAIDGSVPVEIDVRREALDMRKVKLHEVTKAINEVLKQNIASDDGRHILLSSLTEGETSQIVITPLTITRNRRFVTRAFTTDDAAQKVFGFFDQKAQGTPETAAQVVGKTDLSRGVDLRAARFLRLSVDGAPAKEIDCAGTRPRATLIGEVAGKINSALGASVASHDGRYLRLTSLTRGVGSRIQFEPTRAADALNRLLGLQPATFRGQDPRRVTFIGTVDLSAGIDLPANAAVKLHIDEDEFEIPLAGTGPVHKALNEIVIAINLKFGKVVAHHDGRHLILASPLTGSTSGIQFLIPSGADSTKALFGITSPRTYQGEDAKPAEIVSQVLPDPVDLSITRFLRLAVNGAQPIAIDCASGVADPIRSTLSEIVAAINAAFITEQIPATAKAHENRLVLTTTSSGAISRIDSLPYTEGDARAVLFGAVLDTTMGDDPGPATLTGDKDLLSPVNLAEQRFVRVSVDGGRPVDVDIAGAAPATTFLDEIVTKINAVFPGMASATDNDRLRLTSPTSGERSQMELLPLRALELIEYPPVPAQDPLPDQSPHAVRHGDRWSVENNGVADSDLRIVLNAPNGLFGPGFVNLTQGFCVQLMIVLRPGESVELWRERMGGVHAKIINPDGRSNEVLDTKILVDKLDASKGCDGEGGVQDKAAALLLPQGRSEWVYLDCHGARFSRDRFSDEQHDPVIKTFFPGKRCVERGIFNISHFSCPSPSADAAVFASTGEPTDPPVEVRFHWLQHQPGAFTVNLPVDLPERFGGRFNQARFAKAGDKPDEFKDVVTEPTTDPDFLVERIASSALVTAKQVERVPIGFVAVTLPFRKLRRLVGGSDTASARLYLAEKDVTGFIEISAREHGDWGNAIAIAVRKSGPARFDVTIRYEAARFENARRIVLGGDTLPALTEDFLKPSPVGILQAKAGGIQAQVTRDRAYNVV